MTSSGLMMYCMGSQHCLRDHIGQSTNEENNSVMPLYPTQYFISPEDVTNGSDPSYLRLFQFDFIVALKECKKMLDLLHTISEYLQSKSLDICIELMAQIKLVDD